MGHPDEDPAPQPLRVDLSLWLDTQPAARSGRLRHTLHYGWVADEIRFLLAHCRFRLLETAADVLCRYLLAEPGADGERAAVDRVSLTLIQPAALAGLAVPSLHVERRAEWASLVRERKPFGSVDVIAETQDVGVYRLNLAPGRGIPLHLHRAMPESEYVLTDGLLCQGEPVPIGTVPRRAQDAPQHYDNPGDQEQSILYIDAPRFVRDGDGKDLARR